MKSGIEKVASTCPSSLSFYLFNYICVTSVQYASSVSTVFAKEVCANFTSLDSKGDWLGSFILEKEVRQKNLNNLTKVKVQYKTDTEWGLWDNLTNHLTIFAKMFGMTVSTTIIFIQHFTFSKAF